MHTCWKWCDQGLFYWRHSENWMFLLKTFFGHLLGSRIKVLVFGDCPSLVAFSCPRMPSSYIKGLHNPLPRMPSLLPTEGLCSPFITLPRCFLVTLFPCYQCHWSQEYLLIYLLVQESSLFIEIMFAPNKLLSSLKQYHEECLFSPGTQRTPVNISFLNFPFLYFSENYCQPNKKTNLLQ